MGIQSFCDCGTENPIKGVLLKLFEEEEEDGNGGFVEEQQVEDDENMKEEDEAESENTAIFVSQSHSGSQASVGYREDKMA